MFPARGRMDEIEITLTVSSLTMLSNCAAWSMIDRLATLKNSAKLRGLGGWRYEPRQVRGDSVKFTVCTERRKLIFRGKIEHAPSSRTRLCNRDTLIFQLLITHFCNQKQPFSGGGHSRFIPEIFGPATASWCHIGRGGYAWRYLETMATFDRGGAPVCAGRGSRGGRGNSHRRGLAACRA